jgi:hypothetical protein
MKFLALFVTGMAALLAAQPGSGGGCDFGAIRPGGPAVEASFFAVPVQRAQEALEDAIQAAGVLLLESTNLVVRGERVTPRVKALNLPAGDESIVGHLEAIVRDGKSGTLVQVETRPRGRKESAPKQSWSAAVVEETDCILKTVGAGDSVTAVMNSPSTAGGDQHEVVLAAETPVVLILRRFVFSGDLRLNRRLVLEVAVDVPAGSDVVIRCGALGVARVKALEFVKATRATKVRIEFESVQTVSGNSIPLHGVLNTAESVAPKRSLREVLFTDKVPPGEFALCAGTRFEARVEGEQRIRIGR